MSTNIVFDLCRIEIVVQYTGIVVSGRCGGKGLVMSKATQVGSASHLAEQSSAEGETTPVGEPMIEGSP